MPRPRRRVPKRRGSSPPSLPRSRCCRCCAPSPASRCWRAPCSCATRLHSASSRRARARCTSWRPAFRADCSLASPPRPRAPRCCSAGSSACRRSSPSVRAPARRRSPSAAARASPASARQLCGCASAVRIGPALTAQPASASLATTGICCSVLFTAAGFFLQARGLKDGRAVVVCTYAAISTIASGVLIGVVALSEPLPRTGPELATWWASLGAIVTGVSLLVRRGAGAAVAGVPKHIQ